MAVKLTRGKLLALTLATKVATAIIVVVINYNTLTELIQSEHQEGTMTLTHNRNDTIRQSSEDFTTEVIAEAVVQEMLLVVTDNNNATFDRYSVYFKDGSVLGLSENPASPQGYSQWSEFDPTMIRDISSSEVQETPISFAEFPLKDHVVQRVREAYRDYVAFCKQSNALTEEIQKTILAEYRRKSTKH